MTDDKAPPMTKLSELVSALGDVLHIVAAAEMEFARNQAQHTYYDKRHKAVQDAIDAIERLERENAILCGLKVNDDPQGDAALLLRLEAMYSHRGDGIPTQYVNPDGPDAAARIRSLLLASLSPSVEKGE